MDLPGWHSPLAPVPAPAPVSVREALPGSAPAIAAAMGDEGDLVPARLARGCRCFGAWLGDEVVAYGWLSPRAEWIGEVGVEIVPPAREGYVWNCTTLPPHRRQGIFRTLIVRIAVQAKSEGLARLWIGGVEGTAEKAVVEAGFVPVLHLDDLSLPWLRWLRVRAAGGASPSLVASGRDMLAAGGRPLRSCSVALGGRSRRH